MEVIERVREFIKCSIVAFDDDVSINDDDHIFKLGFVDSLFALQLVNFVEYEFGISVTEEELILENFCSVNAVTVLVDKKLSG